MSTKKLLHLAQTLTHAEITLQTSQTNNFTSQKPVIMKKAFTIFFLILSYMFVFNAHAGVLLQESVNLNIQNLNLGYDAYNDNTKQITGVYFGVGAQLKTSSTNTTQGFTSSLWILPSGATKLEQGYMIWSDEVDAGKLHQGGSWMYGDPDNETNNPLMTIDLSNLSGAPAGDYFLVAYVDDIIDGHRTDDNAASFNGGDKFHYTPGSAAAKADLSVSSVTYDFDKPFGVISNLKVNIANTGGTDAAVSKIKFEISYSDNFGSGSVTVGPNTLAAVAKGSSIIYTSTDIDLDNLFQGDYSSNTVYKFVVTVDPGNTVSESNENNNAKEFSDLATTTGVEDEILQGLGINVPNPVTKAYLASLHLNANITAIDLYTVNGTASSIDAAAAGLYVVKFATAKGVAVKRLVIE